MSCEYVLFLDTVRGYQHVLKGQVLQDYAESKQFDQGHFALAMADGHGSNLCFRSDIGAKIAVRVSLKICQQFEAGESEFLISNFAAYIHHLWMRDCMHHLSVHPFEDTDLEKLNALQARKLRANALFAYGTTLSVLYKKDDFYFWKLGDGNILSLSSGLVKTHLAVHSLGEETHSLAMENAHQYFQHLCLDQEKPEVILMSTDGYAKSFKTESDFLKTIHDYNTIFRTEPSDFIPENFKSWLRETSEYGSGDDISVALVIKQWSEKGHE